MQIIEHLEENRLTVQSLEMATFTKKAQTKTKCARTIMLKET